MLSASFCLCLLVTSCLGSASPTETADATRSPGWDYTDLRLLDPLDSDLPTHELIAGYSRWDAGNLHLRLDMLELAEAPDFDLYLAFDLLPGGETSLPIQANLGLAWEALFKIAAQGKIELTLANSTTLQTGPLARADFKPPSNVLRSPGLRLQRDPLLDTLVISFNRSSLGGFNPIPGASVQVWLTPAGGTTAVDTLGPLRLNSPPPAPAQVLLTFWNSLPAYTSLQALRRWDGAHTGPLGGRHGLLHLLRAARQSDTPLFLLDLNQPAGLSALDLLDQENLIQEMSESGLLGLPQVLAGFPASLEAGQLPGWALARLIVENHQAAVNFGRTNMSGWFIPGGLAQLRTLAEIQSGHARQTAFLAAETASEKNEPDPFKFSQPTSWQNWLILPIPGYDQAAAPKSQVDQDGPTLAVRRALVETALTSAQSPPGTAPVLVLGGDLPASAWGNPQIARSTLRYLHSHPWVRLLGPADLNNLTPSMSLPLNGLIPEPVFQTQPAWLEGLRVAPNNPIGASAWQAFQAIYAPTFPASPALVKLRQHYAGQIGMLLAAARWADNPVEQAGCTFDLDMDGQAECLLASKQVLAIFEQTRGGGLTYLFIRDQSGDTHQVIAPSSILINGQSPAENWDLKSGLAADPETLPGAFFNPGISRDFPLEIEYHPGRLLLREKNTQIEKAFRLLPDGIAVSVTNLSSQAAPLLLPINLDPWLRFEPGWAQRCHSSLEGQTWRWGCRQDSVVEVRSSAPIQPAAFNTRFELLHTPEDPNQDVLPGQRLPFPLAVVQFQAGQDITCTIRLR